MRLKDQDKKEDTEESEEEKEMKETKEMKEEMQEYLEKNIGRRSETGGWEFFSEKI